MISAVIIDDERSAIVTLTNDLDKFCPQVVLDASFTRTDEALAYLNTNEVDLIFLDIDMPIMNGFDLIQAIEKPVLPAIIFVTAYSEFAIRAFKVSALDYLLKPIDPEELKAALAKIEAKNTSTGQQQLLFKTLLEQYTLGQKGKIALPVNDGYHIIDPGNVIYCRADGAYTEVVMEKEKSFLISKTLGRTQELMPEAYFERVHQSYLINLNHIKKFRKGDSPVAIMSNDEQVKVSRLNKDRLAARLGL
ncbi:MAG: LytTR family DNA-binding domain-containing protein [Pedobacter sp.]|nr:LytTR family DNA-binding domain-containing protein [Pedobacter sp.]MDQ8054547.1 LytTR family DNA-binding domain-containing protein [Pedobacter sp.]